MTAPDGFSTVMVSLESLDRRTAAGNHIEAVRSALSEIGEVTVCGDDGRSITRYARTLLALVRAAGGADIGYVRQHPLTLPYVLLLRSRGVPVVLEVNGPPSDALGTHAWTRPLLGLFRLGLRWSARLSCGWVVPTPGLAEFLRHEVGGGHVAVIPAGFDESVFHPDAGSHAPHHRRYVCFVGARAAWQGVDVILSAVQSPRWPDDVDVLLVGGFDELDLSSLPADVRRRIVLMGRRPGPDVANVLRHALCSVSAKTYQSTEGIDPEGNTGQAPLKVYESLGCATPVIVSDVPIQNRLIEGSGAGIVIPPDDAEALADAVSRYATDPDRRETDSHRAAEASAAYSWTALSHRTREFVRARLADHRSR